jgi:hypothetical protein
MTASRRQKYAQIDLKPQDGGHTRSPHDFSKFHEVSCRPVCFHGFTVALRCSEVLIEKIY